MNLILSALSFLKGFSKGDVNMKEWVRGRLQKLNMGGQLWGYFKNMESDEGLEECLLNVM